LNPQSQSAPPRRAAQWLKAQRQSTRVSFVLQLACRVLMSVCSLVWTPLLLGAMGKALNGAFLNLQSLGTAGGLGDLGLGGTVNIQTSRQLGQGRVDELQRFLAAARGFFLLLGLLAFIAALVLAPHLFAVAKFNQVSGVGPLPVLGLVLAGAVLVVMVNSYATSLNYGCGNVLWPIIPGFLLLQAATLGQFLFARQHLPLWVVYLPIPAAGLVTLVMSFYFVRVSHPLLGTLLPIGFDWRQIGSLLGKSFWVYLYCVSAGIYLLTDQFMVSHGFGPATLPTYVYNRKLCELALFAINSACLVSLPKITQWFASPQAADQDRARQETERLSRFQIIVGCAAALGYLAVNDVFIRLWLGRDFQAPFSLQLAFAALMVTTAAGQAGFDMAGRCCEHGMRVGGISILIAAVINFCLAWLAMRQGWLWGIALATAVAQVFVMLALGWFTARQMKLSWWRLTVRNGVLGLVALGIGVWEHHFLQPAGAGKIIIVLGADVLALAGIVRLAGVNRADLRNELDIFKGIIGR
jgi:O-antigen/teichoic acid export membrane protein